MAKQTDTTQTGTTEARGEYEEARKRKDLFSRILSIDRRILYAAVLLMTIIPLLQPFGLPMRVDPLTQKYYDAIESLPAGSYVLVSNGNEPGAWGEVGPFSISTYAHLFRKHLKHVTVMFYRAEAQSMLDTMILPKVDKMDAKYGQDYVVIGFVPGAETAMAAFANDPKYPVKDAYGAMLADLPLMKNIKTVKDFALVIGLGSVVFEVRQITGPNKLPYIVAAMTPSLPEYMVYYNSGMIQGIIRGIIGAAEYEFLLKLPGRAIKSNDVLSLIQMFLIAMVVVTNIVYFVSRRKGGK